MEIRRLPAVTDANGIVISAGNVTLGNGIFGKRSRWEGEVTNPKKHHLIFVNAVAAISLALGLNGNPVSIQAKAIVAVVTFAAVNVTALLSFKIVNAHWFNPKRH